MRAILAATLAVWLALPAPALAAVENPVEAGRESLGEAEDFPWYDAKKDDLKAIPLRVREESKPTTTSGSAPPMSDAFWDAWTVAAWIGIGAIIAILVGLLLRAWLLNRDVPIATRYVSTHAATVDRSALPVPVVADESDLLAVARRLYEQGEYGRAMVYVYSHLLVRLDERHVIRLARGKTNRQYLREVGRRGVRDIFESAMTAFEEAFFGRRALERGRFEETWRRLGEFDRLVEEAAA